MPANPRNVHRPLALSLSVNDLEPKLVFGIWIQSMRDMFCASHVKNKGQVCCETADHASQTHATGASKATQHRWWRIVASRPSLESILPLIL